MRKGSKGPEVESLQKDLIKSGYHQVTPDAHFGAQTDLAVRAFQRSKGLLPDGIAGPETLRALAGSGQNGAQPKTSPNGFFDDLLKRIGTFIQPTATHARSSPALHKPSSHPAGQKCSTDGLRFILGIEAQRGVSNHLYWPKGASGVTLGAGYDMKERSADTIYQDLKAIGLDDATARKASEGHGKKDEDARKFAEDNKKLIDLTEEQEVQLLKNTVPKYENIVRNGIHVHLLPQEFDALVCFAYNPGGRFTKVASLINAGKVADAMAEIKKANTSKHVVMAGLTKRREKEVNLYLYGKYTNATAHKK
ncbi:MAG TPA: peptidoglycan-binding protein [Bryobacteraceae bacterium]|nr:peptidoglycan-binding protein [Bryobacteraceae bacterium]